MKEYVQSWNAVHLPVDWIDEHRLDSYHGDENCHISVDIDLFANQFNSQFFVVFIQCLSFEAFLDGLGILEEVTNQD